MYLLLRCNTMFRFDSPKGVFIFLPDTTLKFISGVSHPLHFSLLKYFMIYDNTSTQMSGGNINTIYWVYSCIPALSDSRWSLRLKWSCLPHLLVTVLLERRLSVALLPLYPLLLFLFGLWGQHELLRYLLLRDELGDGARFPDPGERKREIDIGGGGEGRDRVWQINERENHGGHMASCMQAYHHNQEPIITASAC